MADPGQNPIFAAKRGGSLWMALTCIGLGFAWVWACLWYPLTDTDIWWHLAAAKLMRARMEFLRVDPFCQSSLGAPWIDLHWGFQVLAYMGWKLGGAGALIAGKCAAVAGALAFALRPHFHRRTWPWLLPMAALGIYHVRFFLDVRPIALTLLGLGIQYSVTMEFLRGNLRRPWLILVPVQIAMANIQGLYPLGAILVSCLALGEFAARSGIGAGLRDAGSEGPVDPRSASRNPIGLAPLAWTVAGLWIAGFATPYGLNGFLLPLSLLARITPLPSNVFSREIAENLPFSELLYREAASALVLMALAAFVLYTFLRARKRTSPGHLLLFLAFSILGCMAQRNLPLALLAGLMAAGRNLQVTQGSGDARRGLAIGAGALACIAAFYGPRIHRAWDYELPGKLETPFRFPATAVDLLAAHPIPGNLFNELRYGGYLEFRLYPKLTYVDGRMILRSAAFYRDFLEAVDTPERFTGYAAEHGLTHALLPIAEDRRFLPLAARLIADGWALVYCDGASALLVEPAVLDSDALSPGGLAGMPLDSLDDHHPLWSSLRARFSGNPTLLNLARGNAVALLQAAGKARAAADLALMKIPE